MDIQKEKLDYTAMLVAEDAITQDQCDTLKLSDGMHMLYSYQLSSAIIDCINWGWSAWLKAKAQAVPEGYHLVKKPKPLIGHNKVDFSQAPKWAKFWLKDGHSKKCWWSSSRPKLDLDIGCFVFPLNDKSIEAPDFEFNGDWTKSITSRKAMIETQEPANDSH